MVKRFSGQKTHVMLVYALLAFFSLAIFGGLHVVEGNAFVGYLELAGAGAIVFVLLGLRLTDNVAVARAGLLLTILTLLLVMLVTGGTQGTGIFWFFMFPVAAFFLAGSREGIFWMALLGVMIGSLWLAGRAAGVPVYYNNIEIRQLVVALSVVSVGIYVYQRSRERSDASDRHSRSELKAYVRQMQSMHEKMDRTKSEFIALTSHQLRTPISAIRWSSEMLLSGDGGRLTSEQHENIQGIEDSNKRLGAIVDTMLLVASLDLGHLDVKAEPIDVPKLAQTILAEEQKRARNKNMQVTEVYEPNLGKVRLDKRVTTVILSNVLSNAFKYTPEGGNVAVTISRQAGAKTKALLIEVADSGLGIPKSQQADIFAKMFRADNAKAKDTDGTGLGLYVVKALLDRLGGKIWFESREGQGTTFWISLPVDEPG
jgi:signal transduction histidine kinase